MANALIYLPATTKRTYTMNFSDVMPSSDALLADIGTSTITATKSDGTDVSSTILTSKTRTGLTLIVTISSLTDGEEYRIRFHAQGTTSSGQEDKVLEIRCRDKIEGGF